MEFLKRLLPKSSEEINIKHIELREWLEGKAQEILDIHEKMMGLQDSIEETKETVLSQLDELKEVDIDDFQEYVESTTTFIEDFKTQPEYGRLKHQAKGLEEKIADYRKKVSRSYYALKKELPEVENIALAVHHLENQILRYHDIARKEEVRLYKSLLARIHQLNERTIMYEEMQDEVDAMQRDLRQLENRKKTVENKLAQLKKSAEYRQIAKTQEKQENVEKKMKRINRKLQKAFEPLEGLLPDDARDYLDRPAEALNNDEGFSIIDILHAIKKRHPDVQHTLDPKYLENMRQKYKQLKNQKKELHSVLEKVSIVMDYKELTYKLEHVAEKIEKLKEKVISKKIQLDELSVEQKRRELEEDLSSFTGYKVTIS